MSEHPTDAHFLFTFVFKQALREQLGVDLVVSPRFDSDTGERKGYFVRCSQRTDLQIDKATYRTYEVALSVGIGNVLHQLTPKKQ